MNQIHNVMRRLLLSCSLTYTEMKTDDPKPGFQLFGVHVSIDKKGVTEGLTIQPLKHQVSQTRILLVKYIGYICAFEG